MVDIWLFHPTNFLNFHTFWSKKFFWVLYGYMQPKKRTMVGAIIMAIDVKISS
jgi:hypothetical protein